MSRLIAILLQRPVYCFWRADFHGQGATLVTPDNLMYSLPTILPCPLLCCSSARQSHAFDEGIGPCHVSGIFLPLRVKSLPLATIYEVKIPLRKWKKSLLQRNPAQMTSAIVVMTAILAP
jgi:hypothetical protein